MDIKLLKIGQIGLSTRSTNALRRANVHTVGDMLGFTAETLSEVRNLGAKSIEEILAKIEECTQLAASGANPAATANDSSLLPEHFESFDTWLQHPEVRQRITSCLEAQAVGIEVLDLLSARAYNLLTMNGFQFLHQILFLDEAALLGIHRMDAATAAEITQKCRCYLREQQTELLSAFTASPAVPQAPAPSIYDLMQDPTSRRCILEYVETNDREIALLGLSTRPRNQLLKNGYTKLSQILFLSAQDLLEIPAMGAGSVDEIVSKIHSYLDEHSPRLIAVCTGDESALWDDSSIQNMILEVFQPLGFTGLSLAELQTRLPLPEAVTVERLKQNIGSLLAAGKLEYVDFRCHRVYPSFYQYAEVCPAIDARSREFLRKRLMGSTLEAIAEENGLTRERVRQIVQRNTEKAREHYVASFGTDRFDEEYYRYFFETYAIDKKDGSQWLGIPPYVWNYLDLMNVAHGTQELMSALEDTKLDAGLRLKIKTYLNRNNLFVDGVWIEKKRLPIEEYVVRTFCKDDVSFEEFCRLYNAFLEREEIPYDEDIYYTDAVLRTRKNALQESRFLLWKQNEQIRYYDIDGRDFTELLDTLNLDAYENIELSTVKFMEQYPEIMSKYDIRNQYELHNLLRKIVPEGSYHDFRCSRMPDIVFGNFDRTAAMLDLLIANAPINMVDFADLIHQEYGFDQATVMGTYLQPLAAYYHQGMYTIPEKIMSQENQQKLQQALTEDFYYMEEIRRLYTQLIPGADPEEINAYNLKNMGLNVLSRYVVQHYPSLDAYCRDILTREDIVDITPYRKRFVYVQAFSQALTDLKRNLDVLEFEPNQLIHFRKLEKAGITKEMLREFCDAVYEAVEDDTYFSMRSLRQTGFESDLFDLGFSDWFYAGILTSDSRFSFSIMFSAIILYKGTREITIKSFAAERIRAHGRMDVYDLMTELSDVYGCKPEEKANLIYKVLSDEVYYDKILERFYADVELYYNELDGTEDI